MVPSSEFKSINELKEEKREVSILNIKKEETPESLLEIQDLTKKDPEIKIEPIPEIKIESLPEIKKEPESEIKIESMDFEEPKQTITFNNNDEILDMGTNKIEIIDVPKDVTTLEKKSEERYNAAIDDDEDTISIGSDLPSIDLTSEIVSL